MGAIVAVLLSGCGLGVRTGAGVSRTAGPTVVGAAVVDASLSTSWVELETILNLKYVRAMFVLGGGRTHTRFRTAGLGPIFADDGGLAGRFGGGLGLSPMTFGPIRPIPYVLYNYNGAPSTNNVKGTLELGLDIAIDQRLSNRTTSTFVIGAALTRESGIGAPEFTGMVVPSGEFSTTGVMVTFGWHFMLERFSE